MKAPEKAIDEKSKPKVSPEVAEKLEKIESISVPEAPKPNGGSSKNERHGDGGRAKSKAEKQIEQYKEQLKTATGREKKQIEQKIKNVQRDAAQKARGEEHSRANKR